MHLHTMYILGRLVSYLVSMRARISGNNTTVQGMSIKDEAPHAQFEMDGGRCNANGMDRSHEIATAHLLAQADRQPPAVWGGRIASMTGLKNRFYRS